MIAAGTTQYITMSLLGSADDRRSLSPGNDHFKVLVAISTTLSVPGAHYRARFAAGSFLTAPGSWAAPFFALGPPFPAFVAHAREPELRYDAER